MSALAPCPFCGSDELDVDLYSVMPDNFHSGWVECRQCEARGPNALTVDGWLPSKDEAEIEARATWTRRAPLPAEQPSQPILYVRAADLDSMQPHRGVVASPIIEDDWSVPLYRAEHPSNPVPLTDEDVRMLQSLSGYMRTREESPMCAKDLSDLAARVARIVGQQTKDEAS